jgi:hypothetical protein
MIVRMGGLSCGMGALRKVARFVGPRKGAHEVEQFRRRRRPEAGVHAAFLRPAMAT